MQHHLEALKESKYCPLWHDQDVRPETLPSLSGDVTCELLIVGGGFTGLWAALQAKDRTDRSKSLKLADVGKIPSLLYTVIVRCKISCFAQVHIL